ncbi:MAG TPA: Wzz/FepE/Etk N-terminal domain-containing protein [Solirubrobacteraceae bacterium]|nr:Wzz/FepE/Etk N-terminal domain-containing protein [Solirubrobacteraceae bacterium]
METAESQMTLREVAQLLRRRAAVVVLVTLLTLAGGVIVAVTHAKRYQSQAKVVLTPILSSRLTFIPAQDSLQALINAYAETARSRASVQAAEAALGRPLHGTATAFTQAGDNSVTVAVTSATAQTARQDTVALLGVFEAAMAHNAFFSVSLISPPSLPSKPVQPRPPLIVGSAAVLGLVLGVLCAALVDYVRRREPGELAGEPV